jgi:undecaprenyl-diphosphatase
VKKSIWPLLFLIFLLAALAWVRISPFKLIEQDIIARWQGIQSTDSIRFFQWISDTISFISLGIPAVFVAIGITRKRKEFVRNGLIILLSVGLGGTISAVIKRTIKEPRPYEVDSRIAQWSKGGSNSFPSGHTTEVSAAALGFSLILFRTPPAMLLSILWALLMMSSRIILGVHNFTDILGGFVTACIGLWIVQEGFRRYDARCQDNVVS